MLLFNLRQKYLINSKYGNKWMIQYCCRRGTRLLAQVAIFHSGDAHRASEYFPYADSD